MCGGGEGRKGERAGRGCARPVDLTWGCEREGESKRHRSEPTPRPPVSACPSRLLESHTLSLSAGIKTSFLIKIRKKKNNRKNTHSQTEKIIKIKDRPRCRMGGGFASPCTPAPASPSLLWPGAPTPRALGAGQAGASRQPKKTQRSHPRKGSPSQR